MLFVAACGGNGSEGPSEPIIDGEPEASPATALAVESAEGCRIDADCQEGRFCYQNACVFECESDDECPGELTCSPRGECSPAGREGSASSSTSMQPLSEGRPSQALRELEIVERPETIREVGPQQKSVSFEWRLSGESPADGIAYRIERSDGAGNPAKLRYAAPGKTFRVELQPGKASPTAEQPGPVSVTIRSPLGNLELLLRPEPNWSGRWEGSVEMDSLGGQQLPLEVWLIGDDPEEMKVALPVGPGHLFSPREAHGEGRSFEVTELTWNESLEVYQARFTYEYRFDEGPFSSLGEGQIERTVRLDVEEETLERGNFRGRVMDLWRGLTEAQTKFGDRKVHELLQYGDFSVERAEGLPAEANFEVRQGRQPEPGLVEMAEPAACAADSFEVPEAPAESGDETWTCAGIETVSDFVAAGPVERADCAMAVATEARSGTTTSNQLQSYFGNEGGSDQDESFEDFLAACADPQDGACQPLEAAPCAMQLLSHASRGLKSDAVDGADKLARYQQTVLAEIQKMASEAYLAQQLGAFHVDLQTRRSWLQQSTAPEQFVQQIEQKTKETLETWRTDVLGLQAELVGRFFRRNTLVALGRPVDGQEATRARREALMQGGMLWRSTVASMTLAAKRWNRMIRDTDTRRAQMERLGERATQMYVLLGLLSDYNRSAGSPGQAALLVGDFADMLEEIERLGTPFSEALYARDAEVVTATSLDPLSDNDSLMSERREDALSAVDEARTEIESLVEEMQAEALQETNLRRRLQQKMTQSANRIVTLCGLPEGCSVDNLAANADKCLKVRPGQCGMHSPGNPDIEATFDPSRVKTSEAGQKILGVLEAYKNLEIAQADLDGYVQKTKLELQELRAFQSDVVEWNRKRLEGVQTLKANLQKQNNLKDQQVQTLVDNLAQRAEKREADIEEMRSNFAKWNQIRVDGAQSSFESQLEEIGLRAAAAMAENIGAFWANNLRAAAEGLPDIVGTSNDPSAPAQMALQAAAGGVEFGANMAANGLERSADTVAAARERNAALREAKLARLEEQAEVNDAIGANEMKALEDALTKSTALTDAKIQELRNALKLAKAQRQAELAYGRDMAELRKRRTAYKKTLVDATGFELKRNRANFRVIRRIMDYHQVVQKAQLEAARFREMNTQLSNLNSLLGGPSVIFLNFQELRYAEQSLGEAREALMDWLVVLEYYAVRPFIAERIQIMLARNPYQLSAIAEKLEELEQSCGGSERSTASVELSVRDDLMALNRPQQGLGEQLSPAERFRQSLQSGYVPVDRQIRYRTGASLSDVIGQDSNGTLTASFSLRLDKFANLPLACNAKLDAMSVQLVGDIGEGQPSVSLLYDGSAQLRSCQPKIDEYVASYASGLTSYGSRTYLDTAGRSASPVASINEFPDKNSGENRTLAGLPLASQYTLLIDTELPNNKELDWSKLEDVEVQLDYTYQDLFPESCD